jgi:hypothetical protein
MEDKSYIAILLNAFEKKAVDKDYIIDKLTERIRVSYRKGITFGICIGLVAYYFLSAIFK